MGDEVLEGYAAHLQIVFDHYAADGVLDAAGFHAFLRESHVSPDPLPDNAVARIFNSGARGKGELGFEEFCECLERVSVKAFQVGRARARTACGGGGRRAAPRCAGLAAPARARECARACAPASVRERARPRASSAHTVRGC